MKRRVVFRKNSKLFLRLNGKEPILPFTTIFQHGWGFRMNWPLPDTIPGMHKIFRRDVSRDIQNILKQPELESYICILKHFSNKRLIIFPRPTSFVQMVLGFGLPFEVEKQSVTLGPFVKSIYYLPVNSTDYTNPSIDIPSERRKRAISTRWNFYSALSAAANYLGYGGKSCVLRAICETAEIPFSDRADIFTEIFHVLFTPSSSQEYVNNNFDHDYHAAERLGRTVKNCERLFPECKVNLMESFTEIFSHF
ncbi:uncharacterized protein CBL_07481 [Carabus blaptoides fortunei]